MYSLVDLIDQYGCFVSRLDLAVCIGVSAGEKKASCPTSLPIVEFLALAIRMKSFFLTSFFIMPRCSSAMTDAQFIVEGYL
jgi:hypothetical protein